MPVPVWFPDAINVTDEIPVSGKRWDYSNGLEKPKLLFHTIEGADPWDIGWPRTWSRWVNAPHLAMNSDRYPDGDWLYQTLPFDKAAYAVRDNNIEDNTFLYQIEMAGRAANVPTYSDQFYEAVAHVSSWFINNMNVPDSWMDFSCAQYGSASPCRVHNSVTNTFSGFMGHCHIGRGVDTHGDPGKLDVTRVRSFMDTSPPEEPMEDQGRNELYVKQGMSGMSVEYWQVETVMVVEGIKFDGNSAKTFITENAPQLTFREWDQAMTDYLSQWTGRNSYGVGASERVMIEEEVDRIRRNYA